MQQLFFQNILMVPYGLVKSEFEKGFGPKLRSKFSEMSKLDE
jgi:hypothetical protein